MVGSDGRGLPYGLSGRGWENKRAIFSQLVPTFLGEEPESGLADTGLCHFEMEERPHAVRLHFLRQEVFAV